MKRTLNLVASLMMTVALAACGGGTNPDREQVATNKIGNEPVQVVSGQGTLVFNNDGSAQGTGTVRSTVPFAQVKSEGNFSLAMNLQPGGRVTLVAFADFGLANGLEFEFHRPSSPPALNVVLRQGGTSYDASAAFASAVDATNDFTIAVDVHNSETPAHLLLWNDTAGPAAPDDFLFNTGVTANSSPGDGKGIFWGLRLENATVKAVAKAGVRHEDDEE